MKNNFTGDGIGLHNEEPTKYNNIYNKKLFDLLIQLPLKDGEFKNGKIHCIKSSLYNEISFRVYNNNYCFDVCKKEEIQHLIGAVSNYSFFCDWDGFEKITPKNALELITPVLEWKF